MHGFIVTYDITTPESAERGDSEENGFISCGQRLRAAICDVLETRTCHCDGISGAEPDCSGLGPGAVSWITVYNGAEFETGAVETRSLHIPETATASTRARIVRAIEQEIGFRIVC